ncbi:hypothetical protein [Nocardia sp. NBC_01329]|uniref:hypothetical protein n=1 Tax=Nocardia sp. NBC_01329 TaxID=2903594 RepID=UPI002E0D845D|nr:hypothetical protein OG405_13130 [Nocardia sp. NBC_01329]
MGNLAELGNRNSEALMGAAGPALREALQRHLNDARAEQRSHLHSFIAPSE